MPSDAAGFLANEDFKNASLPPCFLLPQSLPPAPLPPPLQAHALQGLN